MSHTELFENIRRRASMWIVEPSFATVTAFVQGYDAACEGGVLNGFREWLILRLDGLGTNLDWSGLVLAYAFPDLPEKNDVATHSSEDDERAREVLFTLIAEFDATKRACRGPGKIFAEFETRFGERLTSTDRKNAATSPRRRAKDSARKRV